MKVKFFFVFCFTVLFVQSFAQVSTISFSQKSYSNDSIFILTKADFISNNIDTIYSGKVNLDGKFECSLNLKQTSLVYIPLDFFKLSFYVEPGKTYKIQIPPRRKLSVAEELSPYFEPIEIIPGIENSDSTELNSMISQFDDEYNAFLSKSFIKAYYTAKKAFTDSAITSIQKKFNWCQNAYFKAYMEYRFSMLKFMAYERENDFIIKDYFNKKALLLNNPAYMDMFNHVFAHYFSVSTTKKWGENLMEDISKAKSPYAINLTLKNNRIITNDTLIDLIILKGLNDAFYDNHTTEYKAFPRKQLLMTLDSMIIIAKTPELKSIANNIKKKVNYMISGTAAPFFALLNQDSVRISLSDLKGKYLYVTFTDIRSYSNANEMSLLKTISEKYAKDLDVVTMCCNGSVSKTREFCKANGYKWFFLTPENTKKLKNMYNVKAFPSYFLIDPYGKIILSPAPAPDANFDGVFITILRGRN